MIRNLTLFFIIIVCTINCSKKESELTLKKGNWKFAIQIDKKNKKTEIPFNVRVLDHKNLIIINAEEKIEVKEIKYKNDSVFIKMPVFGSELKGKIRDKRIKGLDFEPKTDFNYFKMRIDQFRKDLNVPYELVFAGPANKKEAAKMLPMLNNLLSYPTAIFIDKKGAVREIHTGFSGPGTGVDYEHYKKETEELIEKLLDE